MKRTSHHTPAFSAPVRRPLSLFAIGAIALLATTAGACKREESKSNAAPAGSSVKKAPEATATRVEVAVLEGGTATSQFVRPGEVIGAREANLAAALGGYVEQVLVESGDTVKKGQVLVKVDTGTHFAQYQLTKVELDDATRELERIEKLGKSVASARVDAAKTRLARAQAQHRLTGTQLERATIRAPFAGTLVDLQVEQGEVAAPGQPIGRLLVLDPITVSVSVTDRDVGSLKVGDVANVTTAGSPNSVEGKVARIEPAADLRTRTFLVEVDVDNPERSLLPGMIATVAFSPRGGGETLMLPQDLLVTKLEGNGVFVVDTSSIARWRPLILGKVVGDQVEVLQGIARGERIVSVGQRGLSDGDKIIAARQGICCRRGEVYFDLDAAAAPALGEPETAAPAAPAAPVKPATPAAPAAQAKPAHAPGAGK